MFANHVLSPVFFAVITSMAQARPDPLLYIVENSGEGPSYVYEFDNGYEGDINTGGKSFDEWLTTFDDPPPGKPGQQGSAIRGNQFRWKSGILPYTMDSSLSATYRATIAKAAEHYKQNTCIKLVPRTNEADYINFIVGRGCGLSYVGKQGGKQDVEVGPSCEMKMGVVVHELMHALGFFHEQSRTDRDTFVDVKEENIDSVHASNFNKYSQGKIDHLGIEYDYDSIMHYPRDAFSLNGLDTIVPISASADRIGQRNGLSAKDIRRISRLYGCSGLKPTVVKKPVQPSKPAPPKPVAPSPEQCANQLSMLFDTDPGCDSNDFCYEVCSAVFQSTETITGYKCDGGVCECNACSSEVNWELVLPETSGNYEYPECTTDDYTFTPEPACSTGEFCVSVCEGLLMSYDEVVESATCNYGDCKCTMCTSAGYDFSEAVVENMGSIPGIDSIFVSL